MNKLLSVLVILSLAAAGFGLEEKTFSEARLTIKGVVDDEQFGRILASGDLNGDGYEDLIAGSYFCSSSTRSNCGKVCVFLGSPYIHTLNTTNASANLTIIGAIEDDYLGEGIAAADVDGDGIDDLVIGIPGYDPTGRTDAGGVFVFRGGTNLFSHAVIDMAASIAGYEYYTIKGATAGQALGTNIAGGDINNDGREDLLIAALPFFGDGEVYSLKSAASFPTKAVIDLLTSTNYSRRVLAAQELDSLGASLICGDLNRDGYDDMVMGATMAGTMSSGDSTGRVYIFWGAQTPPTGQTINLASASANVTILGRLNRPSTTGNLDFDDFGESLTILDFNNDGFLDLAIGAPEDEISWTDTQNDEPGFTYVLFGSSSWASSINLSVSGNGYTDKALSIIGSDTDNESCGDSLAGGRIDHDFIDDLTVLATYAGRTLYPSESKTYIINGSNSRAAGQALLLTDSPQSYVIYGNKANISSVMSLTVCNFNGMNQTEVFIGAPFFDKTEGYDDSGGVWGFYLDQPDAAVSNSCFLYE